MTRSVTAVIISFASSGFGEWQLLVVDDFG